MDNNFSNIDEVFKNAFEHAEAPHTPAEMHADWNQVASHIPQVPSQTQVPHQVANQFAGGIGKTIGFGGIGASVLVAAVVLYSIYVKKPETTTLQNKPNTENTITQPQASKPTDKDNALNAPQHTLGYETPNVIKDNGKTRSGSSLGNGIGTSPIVPFVPFTKTPDRFAVNPQKADKATTVFPPPAQPKLTLSDSTICIFQYVTATTNAPGSDNTIDWGDGYNGPIMGTASHFYMRADRYPIQVSGSFGSLTKQITIIDKPKARFTAHQLEKWAYSFNNTSVQAIKYAWNFGDGSKEEYGYYASHNYNDTGSYRVRLRAYNAGGCSDSFVQYINVNNFVAPNVSTNAITPNGDNKNDDVFITVGDETNFTWTIVDHSGKIVFQTNDKNKHWAGKNQFTGSDCMPGAYFYSISYSLKQSDEPRTKNGTITIIR